jgi:hypothetical protein
MRSKLQTQKATERAEFLGQKTSANASGGFLRLRSFRIFFEPSCFDGSGRVLTLVDVS